MRPNYIHVCLIFLPVLLQGMAAYDVIALQVAQTEALRTVEVAIQMRQLHALALHDGVVGQVALDATAQAAACRAFEIATNMREMHAIANPDVMFRYDYAYEAMQGQRVVQESVQDFPCHVVSSDYQSHLQVVERLNEASSNLSIPSARAVPFVAENVRSNSLKLLQASVVYKHEFQLVGSHAKNALQEGTCRASRSNQNSHLESWRLAREASQRYEVGGYSRKNIISAIRQSAIAKEMIGRINQHFLDVCRAFETAYASGDFNETLRLLGQMRSDIEALKKMGPISYVLNPEITRTMQHIEWPLLKCALGGKNGLKARDYEQIAWAFENHFISMHRYTYDTKVILPDGVLKNVIDNHYQSRFGLFERACKSTRYYAVYGKRDLSSIETLRTAYQEALRQKSAQPQAVQEQAASACSSVADYVQLHNQVLLQHQKIIQKNGVLTDGQRSREDALAGMVQGNLAIESKKYVLSNQAQETLEKACFDVSQFVECTGNLIQQDTHAKLVNALNSLAGARPFTLQGRLIKNGALDCVQAGNLLNKEGHIREAMLYSDVCTFVVENLLHVADRMNPFVLGTRALLNTATAGLHAASAYDLAQSLDTLRTNIDEFRTGFVSGTLHGATNIPGIYDGLCNTVHALGEFAQSAIAFNAEQEALTFAIESGSYDDARIILAERTARAEQNAAAIHHLTGRITDFIDHMTDMTPQEWRDAGFTTGDFVGREAAQFGAMHVGLRGLSRIGEGISNTIRNVETLGRELALSAQLSGNPAAPSIADILKQGHRVENVVVKIGTEHISGISAVHPEFIRAIPSAQPATIPQLFFDGTSNAVANTGSNLVGRTATILSQIGPWLNEAQPGHIDLSGSNEQSTTETNSPASSSSSSSSTYIAATEDAAKKTGQIAESSNARTSQSHINPRGRVGDDYLDIRGLEEYCEGATIELKITSDAKNPVQKSVKLTAAEKELNAKAKKYQNEYNEKQKIKCEKHGEHTVKGRHEVTELPEQWHEAVPGDSEHEILSKPFDHTRHTHVDPALPQFMNENPKSMVIDYEHITTPELTTYCSKGEVSGAGFHHDPLGTIERSGLIEVTNKVMLPNGCYKLKWRSNGSDWKPSTMFPEHWTRAQTIEKIYESMNNTTEIVLTGKNRYAHVGVTSEGISILSVIQYGEHAARVISAYPKFGD